jgi:antitoxin VapB
MQTAKIFMNGRSQAVRLPAEFRFEGDEVLIRRDPASGDIVLSPKPVSLNAFFRLRNRLLTESQHEVAEFLEDREQREHVERDWL